jgi:hypothetical protein
MPYALSEGVTAPIWYAIAGVIVLWVVLQKARRRWRVRGMSSAQRQIVRLFERMETDRGVTTTDIGERPWNAFAGLNRRSAAAMQEIRKLKEQCSKEEWDRACRLVGRSDPY